MTRTRLTCSLLTATLFLSALRDGYCPKTSLSREEMADFLLVLA